MVGDISWFFLHYPLYLDPAFLIPFVIPFIFCLIKKNTKEMMKYAFKGFPVYISIIIIVGIINYLSCYSYEYFVLLNFLKLFCKMLVLYPMCRFLIYILSKEPTLVCRSIIIYSYFILGSIIMTEAIHYFFDPDIKDFILKVIRVRINDSFTYRYSAILKEPSYISCLGISLILILLELKGEKIPLSALFAFVFATLISKSLSVFILLVVVTSVVFLCRKSIKKDYKTVVLLFFISLLSFLFDKGNRDVSKFSYYVQRVGLVRSHRDNSFNDRLRDGFKITRQAISTRQKLFGVALGQEKSFLKDFQSKGKRIKVSV